MHNALQNLFYPSLFRDVNKVIGENYVSELENRTTGKITIPKIKINIFLKKILFAFFSSNLSRCGIR